MGIESKHSYRFGYLKSEAWQTVRIEVLAREKGRCKICHEFSISNDAHHVEYPDVIWETKGHHLEILCRGCHEFMHSILSIHELKTHTREQFDALCKSIQKWKMDRQEWVDDPTAPPTCKKAKVAGLDRCKKCHDVAINLEEFIFFKDFGGSSNFKQKLCPLCKYEAQRFLNAQNIDGKKWHDIYKAWKRHKIPTPIRNP